MPEKRYRFYLTDEGTIIFPTGLRIINMGSNRKYIVDIAKDRIVLDPAKDDFVVDEFTGVQGINGDIYTRDIVRYRGQNCIVDAKEVKVRDYTEYGIIFGDSFVSFDDIDEMLEIVGDTHTGLFDPDDVPEGEMAEDYYQADAEDEDAEYEDEDGEGEDDSDGENDDGLPYNEVEPEEDDSREEYDYDNGFIPDSSNKESESKIEEDDDFEDDYFMDDDDYFEEDTNWDDEAAGLIELAYAQAVKHSYDVYVYSAKNRRDGTGAWAYYIIEDNGEQAVVAEKEETTNTKVLELLALKNLLTNISSPALISVHIISPVIKNFVEDNSDGLDSDTIPEGLEELVAKNHFNFFQVSPSAKPVEILIAADEAKAQL